MIRRRCILITGASGAIGGGLAREFASPGVRLLLHGRNMEQLKVLAADCEERGAQVRLIFCDLLDTEALLRVADQLALEDLPDLLIANAGLNTNIGKNGGGERWQDVDALLTINLRSVMVLVTALLPAMRARGSGQIALVSSLAAYFGLPLTPSYCASKAAIKAYGEALRGWLAPEGIRVSVIMPGYVHSPMCDAMPGPKPFVWTPERAARAIRRGLERDKARISFPFPLNLGGWWLAVLPAGLSTRIVRWLGYGA